MGTIKGTVVYAGHKASRSFLRRYTGYVEQFGKAQPHSPRLHIMTAARENDSVHDSEASSCWKAGWTPATPLQGCLTQCVPELVAP